MIKKNKIFILLLFSIILLSTISAVSAESVDADNGLTSADMDDLELSDEANDISSSNEKTINENALYSSNDESENAIDDSENLGTSNDNEIVGDDENSFAALDNLINGNSDSDIYLEHNYTFNRDTDSAYAYGIIIGRSVTIHGNGYTITGSTNTNDKVKLFNVTANGVTFVDISFKNLGHYSGSNRNTSGGAIYSSVFDTKVINSSFDNCRGYWGGAIHEVTAENCSFSNCVAISSGLGGAMYSGKAINCNFTKNYANMGGATYSTDVVNCTFFNNTASQGGAMYMGSAINSTFIKNNASSYGGAMRSYYSGDDVINCTFINNTANYGGAIYSNSLNEAINCTFINNSARSRYGGTYYMNLILCTFYNNTAPSYPNYDIPSQSYMSRVVKLNFTISNSITVDYPNQVEIPVKLAYKDHVFDGVEVCVELRKNGVLIENSTCLTGSTWSAFLDAGSYTATFKLLPPYINNASNTSNIKVNGIKTYFLIEGLDEQGYYPVVYYNVSEDNYLVATLVDEDNNTMAGYDVSIYISGQTYNLTTDENGKVNVSVNHLKPSTNTYYASLTFAGDGAYENTQSYPYIKINGIATKISLNNMTITVGDDEYLVINFTENATNAPLAGYNLSIYFNGYRDYTTDENGQVIIPLKDVVPPSSYYSIQVSYAGNDEYENTYAEARLYITKKYAHFEADNMTIYYNRSGVYTCNLVGDDGPISNAYMYIRLNGQYYYNYTDENGMFSINTPILNAGYYQMYIYYSGNNTYYSSSAYTYLNITKVPTKFNATNITVRYNSTGEFFATLVNETNGPLAGYSVYVSFNGNGRYVNTDENGQIKVDVPILPEGIYPVTLNYGGSQLYAGAYEIFNITVSKIITTIEAYDIDLLYNDTTTLVATFWNESGDVLVGFDLTVTFNGQTYDRITDGNGQITLDIPVLPANTYPVTINFAGKDLYKETSKTINVNIRKIVTVINSTDVYAFYDEGKIVATLTNESGDPLIGRLINLTVGDYNNASATDSQGQIIFDLLGVDLDGNYTAVLSFIGDELYADANKEINVYVGRLATELSATTVSINYDENGDIIAKLIDNDGNPLEGFGIVFVNEIMNKSAVTNSTGEATVTLDKYIIPNEYVLDVIFEGSERYLPTSAETSFVVNKMNSTVFASDFTTVYNSGDYFIVTLKDNKGNLISNRNITISTGGQRFSELTDENGEAKFALKLAPKIWSATITFEGDEIYVGNYTAANITVKKIINDTDDGSGGGSGGNTTKLATKITSSKLTTPYLAGKYLVATLKDKNGKAIQNAKISIKIAGKTYNRTTDSNGQIKLKINLIPKNYTAEISFAGNSKYIKSSTTTKVVVTKVNPKIAAANKSFKVSTKTKKYTVTLKNHQNKILKNSALTLKVNGVTYKARTNSKGQATFKITKLTKKGTFKAIVRFNGNSCYNKISKTIKITAK